MIPHTFGLEAVDEGLGVFVTEVGGTGQHDTRFVEGHGGAGVREGGVIGAEECRGAGDIEALRVVILIRESRIIKERIGVVEQGFADVHRVRFCAVFAAFVAKTHRNEGYEGKK